MRVSSQINNCQQKQNKKTKQKITKTDKTKRGAWLNLYINYFQDILWGHTWNTDPADGKPVVATLSPWSGQKFKLRHK